MGLYIDLDKARQMIAAAIEERGEDYVYPRTPGAGCAYVHHTLDGEEPGCGVGMALIKAGVPIESFDDLHINTGCGAHSALVALKDAGIIEEFTVEASVYLNSFQESQDSGDTWGVALSDAESSVEHL